MARLDYATRAAVVALLAGWASAQYPFVLLRGLELEEAAAGSATQEAFLIAMAAGVLILVPSLPPGSRSLLLTKRSVVLGFGASLSEEVGRSR